ncbi:MAG: KxYKxGKxW signal peptide domain-containing protein [Staphylococcus epidermidis]|nr:KxYKxGKxW signal peptide domain-containing protein [Staphylococcus epidermidis]
MTKKIKRFKENFKEEKARVRLYKSGKNWVKAGIREIQLMKVMGLPFAGQKVAVGKDLNSQNSSFKKNALKTSAVVGGAFTFNMLNNHEAFAASETPVTSEISSNSTTVGDQTSTKESKDSAASTESKDSAASTESKDSAAMLQVQKARTVLQVQKARTVLQVQKARTVLQVQKVKTVQQVKI